MAAKYMQELRNLSIAELDEKLVSLKQRLLQARFQAAGGRLEKPSDIRKAKKDIARILTIKKELTRSVIARKFVPEGDKATPVPRSKS